MTINIKKTLAIVFGIISIFMFNACGNKPTELKAGSICSIEDGDGKYGIVKILVITSEEAHVKIYKNKYDARPKKVDLKDLSLGSIGDKDGFGIGHVPLHREGFDEWKPLEIAFEEVSKEELEGYEMWKARE